MYNEARMFGVATGIAVGLVLALIIIRTINRDKKLMTEYDEMQKLARGQAYKYAFYAVMIYEALVCWLSMGVELPAEQSVIHFFGIFIGITVQACYCIWKDAYVGLNTNLKRYIIMMTIASLINLFTAFMAWRNGELFVDGKFQLQTINLLCGLMFAAIGAVGLVKKLADREEDA